MTLAPLSDSSIGTNESPDTHVYRGEDVTQASHKLKGIKYD